MNENICNELFPRQTQLTDLHFFVRDDRVYEPISLSLDMIESISRGEDLLIIGEGGSGKTSLFLYILSECLERKIFPLFWPLGARIENSSPGDFFRVLTKKIVYYVQNIYGKPTFRKGQELLSNINSWGLTFGPGTVEGQIGIPKYEQDDRWLDYLSTSAPGDFLDLATDVNKVTGTSGMLIMLDDADLIPKSVFEFFRDVFPDNGKITLFVASGVLPFVTGAETLRDLSRRLLRPFTEVEIYPFENHHITRLIQSRLTSCPEGYWMSNEHIEAIYMLSRGNPFIAYQLARNCCRFGLRDKQLRLTQYVIDQCRGLWGYSGDSDIYDLLEPR